MSNLTTHKEDFGILLGIPNIDASLNAAIQSVWLPYWRSLPRSLQTPRQLANDKEIVYSMLESLGTRLISERVDLEEQLKAQRADALTQRHAFLRTLATTAEFAASCEAFDVSFPAEEHDDESMDTPFDLDADAEFLADSSIDPLWKVTVTFTNARGSRRLTNILTHQEFVTHFANIATRVSADPDPDYISELEDVFNSFNAQSLDDQDGLFSDRGPTLR
jgi:hypothetical protein